MQALGLKTKGAAVLNGLPEDVQEPVCFITSPQSPAVFYLLRAVALARIFISVAPAVESQV